MEVFRVGARVMVSLDSGLAQAGQYGTIVKGPYDPVQWAIVLDNEPKIDGETPRLLAYSSELVLQES